MSLSIKHLFDFVAALILLILLAPVMLAVTVAVLLTMGRPILFRQNRPGREGRPFELLKFRTMLDRTNSAGELLSDGERLTPLGRFLRSSSLDELPELLNILRGEMSLVGPRPLLMEYLEEYSEEQFRRHEVRPGITGWAQINGRNSLGWEEKFRLDVWYVDHRHFWLDLKILSSTIWTVLSRRGVNAEGCATMTPFRRTNKLVEADG